MKYPINGTWIDIFDYAMRAKRIEPISIKGEVVRRNVWHRFEINTPDAITASHLAAENITANNSLFKRLKG